MWTAPSIDQIDEAFVGDDRMMIEVMLDSYRAEFLHKCAGLTGDQLATRSTPPSPLSLQGLIRHLTDTERSWFRRRFAGEDVELPYGDDDACFERLDPAGAADDRNALIAEWAACRQAVAGAGFDDTFEHPRYGAMSLRWMHLHMIGEYAGHCGHADLLRERIDGVTFK